MAQERMAALAWLAWYFLQSIRNGVVRLFCFARIKKPGGLNQDHNSLVEDSRILPPDI
jgi:hypothetical protein